MLVLGSSSLSSPGYRLSRRERGRAHHRGKWDGEKRRLLDRETLFSLTGEASRSEQQQGEDIFERHYKYRK